MPTWQHYRALDASLAARGLAKDDPRRVDARQKMRVERLAEYIELKVGEAPPLTQEQCDRIALALHGRPQAVAAGGDAA